MNEFVTAFIPVFLAELGDKTQLAALAMASGKSRSQKLVVFLASSAALTACSVIAVLLGAGLGAVFANPRPVRLMAGALFLFFAYSTWRSRAEAEEEEETGAAPRARSLFGGVFVSVFLAEMGDKTQITTLGLAGPAAGHRWEVLIAAAAALSLSAATAIAASALIDRILPPKRLKIVAAAVFAVLGILQIVAAFRG